MTVAVLVLAAGRGERLGHALPKAFVPLKGRSLLARSLATLSRVPEVSCLIPVVARADLARYEAVRVELEAEIGSGKLRPPVPGGVERQDSVAAGLAALPGAIEWVAVHDAARCLVSLEEVARVIAVARAHGAALLAHPARDTIKRVRGGCVVETPPRSECWVAQTPQVFRLELLREAMAKARAEGLVATDDAQLVERLGVPVHVVEGSPRNLKLTWPGDLAAAEAWLSEESGRDGEGGE